MLRRWPIQRAELGIRLNKNFAEGGLKIRYRKLMKKELMVAASLMITHTYSRSAEELCASDLGLSEDSKKFIRREVEQHCNFIMGLMDATKFRANRKRFSRRRPNVSASA